MKVMSIEELHQKLVNHEIDVKEYYQELFEEVDFQQKRLNAFVTVTKDEALKNIENLDVKENEILIEISDKGKGIENIDIAKEPLYTTKPNLERSGMGFTIMESFMDKVEVESVVGLGTKVTMSKTIKPKIDNEESDEEFEMITKE